MSYSKIQFCQITHSLSRGLLQKQRQHLPRSTLKLHMKHKDAVVWGPSIGNQIIYIVQTQIGC